RAIGLRLLYPAVSRNRFQRAAIAPRPSRIGSGTICAVSSGQTGEIKRLKRSAPVCDELQLPPSLRNLNPMPRSIHVSRDIQANSSCFDEKPAHASGQESVAQSKLFPERSLQYLGQEPFEKTTIL